MLSSGVALAVALSLSTAAVGAVPCERTLTEAEFQRSPSAAERAELVESLATMVEALYIDTDRGRRIATALRENAAGGRYGAGSASDLATRLEEDMRAVVPDRHLQVRSRIIEAQQSGQQGAAVALSSEERRARREQFRRTAAFNAYGVERVEILGGNVGYIKLLEFWMPAFSGESLTAAMTMLRDVDALIFDLRESYGGHEDVVSLIMGYFLLNPSLLVTATDRMTGETTQRWSTEYVPGAPDALFSSDIPVYVLTSNRRTFSAAELLALALKNRRRAVVVGEQTRGGANGGEFRPLSCRFDAFIPHYGNLFDGVSWEGTGVAPDIAVDESVALDIAYREALTALTATPLAGDAGLMERQMQATRSSLLENLQQVHR